MACPVYYAASFPDTRGPSRGICEKRRQSGRAAGGSQLAGNAHRPLVKYL